jgi:hypothetical protein
MRESVYLFGQVGQPNSYVLEHGRPEDVAKSRQEKLSNQLIRAFFLLGFSS